jgi:hypothetical protein
MNKGTKLLSTYNLCGSALGNSMGMAHRVARDFNPVENVKS